MKKAPLYSRSRQRAGSPAGAAESVDASQATEPPQALPSAPAPSTPRRGGLRGLLHRHPRPFWAAAALALVLLGGAGQHWLAPPPAGMSQQDFDAAVRHALKSELLPSPYTRAYRAIRRSVVRVIGMSDASDEAAYPGDDPKAHMRSTGSGVVIIDNGTILTNLHVVLGARRIRVTFADGHESDATMVGMQPENDLAVLRAASIPDDLPAATMRGTGDLLPGDEVVAVGFPFGIGPSVSGGVVSGLKRQFRGPDGDRLTNLIQFDAAANPGNSGGPLVTMDGSLVGIVTAILNPGDQGTFIGIGFAVPIENAAAAAGLPPF